jgi:hypothetical protein
VKVYLFEVIKDIEEDSTFNKPLLNKYNNNPHTIRPDPPEAQQTIYPVFMQQI